MEEHRKDLMDAVHLFSLTYLPLSNVTNALHSYTMLSTSQHSGANNLFNRNLVSAPFHLITLFPFIASHKI